MASPSEKWTAGAELRSALQLPGPSRRNADRTRTLIPIQLQEVCLFVYLLRDQFVHQVGCRVAAGVQALCCPCPKALPTAFAYRSFAATLQCENSVFHVDLYSFAYVFCYLAEPCSTSLYHTDRLALYFLFLSTESIAPTRARSGTPLYTLFEFLKFSHSPPFARFPKATTACDNNVSRNPRSGAMGRLSGCSARYW